MEESCDIAIVGAGAAGLAAGIFAAEAAGKARRRIVLLDGAAIIGAKILVSGGGRCNVTHDRITPADYFGPRTLIRNVLAAFDERATVRWMESLGVALKTEETGKLFPVSDTARTVVSALLARLGALDVDVRPGHRVTDVRQSDSIGIGTERTAFRILMQGDRMLHARRVILCTGGRSLPRTGSDGAGWAIARRLGHAVTDTFAALVPLVLDPAMFHAKVSGLSHAAELSTFIDGKRVDQRTGSLLWTHFGISGPVVMDASRFWTMGQAGRPAGDRLAVQLRCSFIPGVSFEQADAWLVDLARARPRLSIARALSERLAERLAVALLESLGIDPGIALGQMSRDARRSIIHGLTALPLHVVRDRGWNYAEVTAGGIPLDQVDFRTMASKKSQGLYLAGEILDCDGRIGGFNFQWAWATGFLAGRAAARSICDGTESPPAP